MENWSGQTQMISFFDKFTNLVNKDNHLTVIHPDSLVTDTIMIKNIWSAVSVKYILEWTQCCLAVKF